MLKKSIGLRIPSARPRHVSFERSTDASAVKQISRSGNVIGGSTYVPTGKVLVRMDRVGGGKPIPLPYSSQETARGDSRPFS